MPTWIALFRGINVGGKNIVKMAHLQRVFEEADCNNVRTYVQSGNVIFDSKMRSKPKLSKLLSNGVELKFGFRPILILLASSELSDARTKCPMLAAATDPKTLHFFFLDAKPSSPDTEAIAKLAAGTETYELADRVFYLLAPDGIARSRLAAGVERKLGVSVTARNLNTVDKLLAMMGEC